MASLEFEIKPAWANVISDTGDIDVLPVAEQHVRGAACSCKPRVEVIGSNLLIVHNSFDKREFIEQAIDIMNGNEDV
jgi:hypothetical protein